MSTQLSNEDIFLYLRVYNYYRELITEGKMPPGTRLPSIRRCGAELSVSRTTVENAYALLAADGYVIAKAQSGFYVADREFVRHRESRGKDRDESAGIKVKYDFGSASAGSESFNFNLWRRYIKSALRQDERLLSYGEPQGEPELRAALAGYASEKRGVVCDENSIVVGAGVQSLLHIVCALLRDRRSVSFESGAFVQGVAVFADHGKEIRYNKPADIIYTTPSRANEWSGGLKVRDRLELIKNAGAGGSIIIEDDYENEFCYFSRPVASVQGLAGGRNVIYISTFSRLLLPSIRISFMALPEELAKQYRAVRSNYNQTASKTEQLALCQFIRDGHLASQTRKLKRLYGAKEKKLSETVKNIFGTSAVTEHTSSGLRIRLVLKDKVSPDVLRRTLAENGISAACEREGNSAAVVLSCTSVRSEDFGGAVRLLKDCADIAARKICKKFT